MNDWKEVLEVRRTDKLLANVSGYYEPLKMFQYCCAPCDRYSVFYKTDAEGGYLVRYSRHDGNPYAPDVVARVVWYYPIIDERPFDIHQIYWMPETTFEYDAENKRCRIST